MVGRGKPNTVTGSPAGHTRLGRRSGFFRSSEGLGLSARRVLLAESGRLEWNGSGASLLIYLFTYNL